MRRCWRTSPWELSHSLSTNRGSPRTSAQIITMFSDRGTRHWVLSCRAQWTILPNDFCSSKISGLRVEAPWHCLIIGRSALRQQWAAPPIQRNRYANLEFAIVWAKIIFAKFPKKKRRIVPTGNVGERPTYLRERIAPPWLLSQDSISSVLLKLKCLAIPNLCKTKLQSLVWQIAKLIHFFWNFNVSCYL